MLLSRSIRPIAVALKMVLSGAAACTTALPCVSAHAAESLESHLVRVNIAPKNLDAALIELASQANVQLVMTSQEVSGVPSSGLTGEYSLAEALNRLLSGTGLTYELDPSGTITVMKAAATPTSQPASSAQDSGGADTSSSETIGEVVVTAQRREQRLRDVPVSVSVTSGESLAKNNISGLQDLSVRLPSVRLATAPGSNLLNIRGVGSGINPGFEQSVGTFVDGVYRGRSRSTAAALFDLERVEVLKGPQTTFFGNNVVAGAFNTITRKPSFEFGGDVSALYAPTDGEYSVELGADLPISDQLAIRVAGKAFGMDGYVRNESRDRDEPRNRDAVGRVSARWEPSDTWRTDIRADFGRLRDHTTVEGVNCPPDPIYGAARGTCLSYVSSGQPIDDELDYHSNNFGPEFNYDLTELALTNSMDLASVQVTSISSYFAHENQITSDGAPFPVPGVGGGPSATPVNLEEDVHQFSQELRLASTTGEIFDYMLGAYYAHEKVDAVQHTGQYFAPFGQVIGPPLTAATPIVHRVRALQKSQTWSVFGSLTVGPIEDFWIDLGFRYSDVTKKILRDLTYGVGGPIPGEGAFAPLSDTNQTAAGRVLSGEFGNYENPRHTDDKLMPSIKLRYQIAPDVMAYVSYTQGFKAGGYAFSPRLFEFGEETVAAYEAGLKATMLSRRLFTTIAFFRSDYDDLQEATQNILASGVIVQTISNAARSRAQGAELSFEARITPNLSLRGDVSYLDAKYLTYPHAPCTALGNLTANCIQDMSGKQRAFAPEVSGNVGFTFVQPINDRLELRMDPLVYFSSSYFQSATADPLLRQPSYAKIDLRVGLGPPDGRWELAAIAKNLTDKQTASFRNQIPSSLGSIWLIPERPRSVALQASVRF